MEELISTGAADGSQQTYPIIIEDYQPLEGDGLRSKNSGEDAHKRIAGGLVLGRHYLRKPEAQRGSIEGQGNSSSKNGVDSYPFI